MVTATTMNTMGLVIDIIGVIGLFKYGLPENVSRQGAKALGVLWNDPVEMSKAAHYDTMARLSLLLLIVGFGLQIWSNYIGD